MLNERLDFLSGILILSRNEFVFQIKDSTVCGALEGVTVQAFLRNRAVFTVGGALGISTRTLSEVEMLMY